MLTKTLLTGVAGLSLALVGAVPASAIHTSDIRTTTGAASGTSDQCTYTPGVYTSTSLKIFRASADYGEDIGVRVRVSTGASDEPVAGRVRVTINGTALASAQVVGGATFVDLPSRLAVGPRHQVAATFTPARCSKLYGSKTQPMTFTVVATPGTVHAAVPSVRAGQRPVVHIRTSTRSGISPTGKVTVKVTGPRTDTRAKGLLKRGRVNVPLGRFARSGTYAVSVAYDGARGIKGDRTRTTFRVKR